MIEHRLKELFRIADRVIVLNYGMKIADGRQRGDGERRGEERPISGTEVLPQGPQERQHA
jgi:branched-chain amino acid transport system ATP-binding protein